MSLKSRWISFAYIFALWCWISIDLMRKWKFAIRKLTRFSFFCICGSSFSTLAMQLCKCCSCCRCCCCLTCCCNSCCCCCWQHSNWLALNQHASKATANANANTNMSALIGCHVHVGVWLCECLCMCVSAYVCVCVRAVRLIGTDKLTALCKWPHCTLDLPRPAPPCLVSSLLRLSVAARWQFVPSVRHSLFLSVLRSILPITVQLSFCLSLSSIIAEHCAASSVFSNKQTKRIVLISHASCSPCCFFPLVLLLPLSCRVVCLTACYLFCFPTLPVLNFPFSLSCF